MCESQINAYCINHPTSKSKYYKDDGFKKKKNNQKKGYCSKCAVVMAQQGIQCHEILNKEEGKRQRKIETFLKDLNDEILQGTEKKGIMDQKINDLESEHEI